MYAEFFGLRELPFNNTPDPRFFFSTPDHDEALASLIYAVQERKGFVLLTGEVGAGKTLVSRMMLKHFGGQITFASVHHAIQGAGDLLEALCSEFELTVEPGASRNKLVHTLHDFLLAEFGKDVPVVLVLDEAQALSVSSNSEHNASSKSSALFLLHAGSRRGLGIADLCRPGAEGVCPFDR